MSLLDVDVDDAQEPQVMPADEEYKLRTTRGTIDTDKNDEPYMIIFFELADEPLAKDFSHFFRLPHEGLSEKDLNRAKWSLKQFKEAFQVPSLSGINEEDLGGFEGWAILGVREDDQYGEQNFIRKFIAPK